MAKEAPLSLSAFAGDVRLTVRQLVDKAEWEEVVAGYHAGIQPSVIRRWLIREKGYSDKTIPSAEAIGRYLRDNHSRG